MKIYITYLCGDKRKKKEKNISVDERPERSTLYETLWNIFEINFL